MTAKRPRREKINVAPSNKAVGEKDRVPPKETAGTGAGGKAMRAKDRVPPKETVGAEPARKAAREKSQPRSKPGGAGKNAPCLAASTPAATITEPAPKKSPRRSDPRVAARRHARLAIETLAAVMADPAAAPTMRISAATTLLQWAYGKPTAEGEGTGGKSEQVIRLAWATAGKP